MEVGGSASRKLRWLTALRRAMAAERQKGKHVLLAGDLNCAVAPKDRCFLHRGLDASQLQPGRSISDRRQGEKYDSASRRSVARRAGRLEKSDRRRVLDGEQ